MGRGLDSLIPKIDDEEDEKIKILQLHWKIFFLAQMMKKKKKN
ncbi:hypothetical protein [Methanobrevibacter arboriphilus]|nr:hypothetical protein [Methanobrevibacter arboriphilus]